MHVFNSGVSSEGAFAEGWGVFALTVVVALLVGALFAKKRAAVQVDGLPLLKDSAHYLK